MAPLNVHIWGMEGYRKFVEVKYQQMDPHGGYYFIVAY